MPDVADRKNPGTQYEATTTGALRLVLRQMKVTPADWTFVDIGSGKGKVLFHAAGYGFQEVIGVEHSETLATIADCNLARFTATNTSKSPIQCVHGDALRYQLPAVPLVIWLYNPFGAELIGQFVERLEAHRAATGAAIRVAYSNPLHAECFDRSEHFHRMVEVETILQGNCLIFRTD
ncbi:MAG: hypothetical protein GKS06_02800 [Acidobacteria bacterium]|nr:hypothetical protein [Acidobacteriota bacterium]